MTEETTEVVAETIETAGEEIAQVVRSLSAVKLQYAAIGAVAGAAVGGLIAFQIAYKRAQLKYEQIADEEIGQMRAHFAAKERAAEPKPSLKETVQGLGYAPEPSENDLPIEVEVKEVEKGSPSATPAATNVFERVKEDDLRGLQDDVWDYDRELQSREDKEVYIIHLDEFRQGNFQGEEHEQTTLTYFIQDDVLIDERDNQIAEIDGTVGLENLEWFGHGSEDANVVYIRNERLKLDIEVLRNGGSYTRDVLGSGADDELQHSAMRRQRPRFDDD